jgi:hypothetical protein
MGNGVNYIPTQEAAFATWVDNFSAYVTANYTALGLALSDATALASMTSTYDTAYSAAIAGSTRGPMSVNVKDVARANVTQRARQLATIMQANPSVTDAQKTALGITLRKGSLTPVPAPTSSPLLTFIAATPLQHTLRWADQTTPALRAMPFGVIALELDVWVYTPVVPPPPPGPPSAPTMVLTLTKQPGAINFTSAQKGMTAYYLGNWRTRTGLQGPVSNSISQIII